MASVAQDLIAGLRDFNAYLRTGKPIADKYRVTRIVRDDDGKCRVVGQWGPKAK